MNNIGCPFCYRFFCLISICLMLSGCFSYVMSGATLVYDRHHVYKQVSDFRLSADITQALYQDRVLTCADCAIDVAVFNGDVLLAGHVPNATLREQAYKRASACRGYRRLFNQLSSRKTSTNALHDSWITTKIRSQIIANAAIDPSQFKVVTVDGIVYLMGDVHVTQAKQVIALARQTSGVKRVVTLLKYYQLSPRPILGGEGE